MSLITADQILCHLIGDYILQSDRMARMKRGNSLVCTGHAIWYSLPFLLLAHSRLAFFAIWVSHFVIDRWGLARYVVWAKNRWLGDAGPWRQCSNTGYPLERAAWLANWLLIIADNTLHLICNGLALKFL